MSVSPVLGDTVVVGFDTFGAGDSYDTGFRYGVDGNVEFQAFQFIPSESGALFDITVALGRTGTNTTAIQFDLYDGTGTLLESFIVPNTVAPGLSPGAVVTFSSVVQPLLSSGQIYWLSFTEPNARDGSSSLWYFNDQGLLGTRLTSALPAAEALLPAFRIEVATGPEPSPLSISPPSGTYVTTQSFDLTFIVEAPGLTVLNISGTLDGGNISGALSNCVIPGTLLAGGESFRCPGISLANFAGIHVLSVTLDLNDGSSVGDTVTYEIRQNTEP